jgi:uncharacterized protein (TIGR00288 family)
MTQDRVMLLIDADNVSVDVMEQAVKLLLNQHGALHVRRAYCTAESALKNQEVFKRLSIKPMVNLSAGKNSTDIAMAVDAIDLVLAERPDVVVIASSDSDFAPLVQRLREKGCVVRGIGQQGKTGAETQDAYDDFTVLEHRKPAAAAEPPKPAAARKAARKTAAGPAPVRTARSAAKKAPAAKKAAASAKTAAAKAAPRKTARKRSAAATSEFGPGAAVDLAMATPDAAPPVPAPPKASTPAPASETAPTPSAQRGRAGATVNEVLACLPELAAGQSLALNVAVQRLREAQLLGKNSSSLKLFSQLTGHFDLLPADNPSQVRLRR